MVDCTNEMIQVKPPFSDLFIGFILQTRISLADVGTVLFIS